MYKSKAVSQWIHSRGTKRGTYLFTYQSISSHTQGDRRSRYMDVVQEHVRSANATMVSPLFTLQHAVEKEFFELGRPRVMTRLSHFDMDDHKRLLHNLSDMLKPEYSVEHLDRNICSTPEITIFLHLDDGGLHGGKLGRPTWPSKGGFHTRVTEVAGSEVIPRYKEVALFHQLLLGDEPPRASLWRRDPKKKG